MKPTIKQITQKHMQTKISVSKKASIKTQTLDLTKGSIWKKLLLFFLPILASSMFQQLYTTADAVIVGQFAGKTGLAAIDSVYSLLKLPINFFVGLSTGAAIIISQFFGAQKKQEFSQAAHTAIAFAAVGGTALSILGILSAPFCLKWMDVPENIFSLALSYVQVYFGGFVFSMLYNVGAGILQASGNSKTPFYILTLSGIANIILDMVFVILFHWGTTGAALATTLSQCISAFSVLCVLMKSHSVYKISVSKIRFHLPALQSIFCLGLPVALQSALYPVANICIQSNINRTGTDTIAAWALCGKLDFLIWISADSLASAISTFTAQNYGAGQYTRVKHGVRIGLGLTLGIVILISAVLFFWCEPLGTLFIHANDYTVISEMKTLMHFLCPFYFLYVFGEVLSGAIRGAGETFKPMLLTLFGTCISRILWIVFAVPKNRSIFTIISSYPVSWLLTTCFFVVFYQIFKHRHLSVPCS